MEGYEMKQKGTKARNKEEVTCEEAIHVDRWFRR